MLERSLIKLLVLISGLALISCENGAPTPPPRSIADPVSSPITAQPPATLPIASPSPTVPSIKIDGTTQSFPFGKAVVVQVIEKTTNATIFDCAPISESGYFKAMAPIGTSFRILFYPRSSDAFKLIESGCPNSSGKASVQTAKVASNYAQIHQLQTTSITIDLSKLPEDVAQLVINLAINGITGKTSEVVLIKDFSLGEIRLFKQNGKLIAFVTNILDANKEGVTTQYTVIINNPNIGGQPGFTADRTIPSGRFIDGVVGGISYKAIPSGFEGKTDVNGRYYYQPGDTITFYLFGRQVGAPIAAGPVATPLSIFGVSSLDAPKVVNFARLLVSLSTLGKTGASIQLPESAPAGFVLAGGDLDFSSDATTQAIVPTLKLVSKVEAKVHLGQNFRTLTAIVLATSDMSARVTSDPAGIDCPGTCTASFLQDTTVKLIAHDGDFTEWTGNCTNADLTSDHCFITLNNDEEVEAIHGEADSYEDIDGDGDKDGEVVDLDNDGFVDIDIDGDGISDGEDFNGDGKPTIWNNLVGDDAIPLSGRQAEHLDEAVDIDLFDENQLKTDFDGLPNGGASDPDTREHVMNGKVVTQATIIPAGIPQLGSVGKLNFLQTTALKSVDQESNSCAAHGVAANLTIAAAKRLNRDPNEIRVNPYPLYSTARILGMSAAAELPADAPCTTGTNIGTNITAAILNGGNLGGINGKHTFLQCFQADEEADAWNFRPGDMEYFKYDKEKIQKLLSAGLTLPFSMKLSEEFRDYKGTEETKEIFIGTTTCTRGGHCDGHAMLLVGYTEEAWIILNSWGEDWGVKGYVYYQYAAFEAMNDDTMIFWQIHPGRNEAAAPATSDVVCAHGKPKYSTKGDKLLITTRFICNQPMGLLNVLAISTTQSSNNPGWKGQGFYKGDLTIDAPNNEKFNAGGGRFVIEGFKRNKQPFKFQGTIFDWSDATDSE